jgi:hypothetical protein
MQRFGKVHLCLDTTIFQIPNQLASVRQADYEEMIEIVRGSFDGANGVWQLLSVSGRNTPTLGYPTCKVGKFNAQDRGLDLVHARRNLSPISKPIIAPCQRLDLFGKLGGVGGYGARVPERSKGFSGIETPTSHRMCWRLPTMCVRSVKKSSLQLRGARCASVEENRNGTRTDLAQVAAGIDITNDNSRPSPLHAYCCKRKRVGR